MVAFGGAPRVEPFEEGREDGEGGEDDLVKGLVSFTFSGGLNKRWDLGVEGVSLASHREKETRKKRKERLTPTFISTFPHKTKSVEFPFPKATTLVCVILKPEQMVVNRPRTKTPITPYFFRLGIWSLSINGIGSKKMVTSKAITIAERL